MRDPLKALTRRAAANLSRRGPILRTFSQAVLHQSLEARPRGAAVVFHWVCVQDGELVSKCSLTLSFIHIYISESDVDKYGNFNITSRFGFAFGQTREL